MDVIVTTYLIYLLLAGLLTVYVGRTLGRNGQLFLVDVFSGDEAIATAVNRLLVVGFYLLNLGFVTLALKAHGPIADAQQSVETLSTKLGAVALVLGAVHFANLYVFSRLRRSSRRDAMRGPVPPLPPAGAPAGGPWLPPSR